jgi:exosortase K
MFDTDDIKRFAIVTVALSIAAAIKYHYSVASVNGLRWILAPTATIVDLLSSHTFRFESYAGYLSDDRSYLIAASCSGINFFIIAFVMLMLTGVMAGYTKWRLIPTSFIAAYITTIIANTVRITTDLATRDLAPNFYGLSREEMHRVEGIVIYFGSLIALFLIADMYLRRCDFNQVLRRLPLPLAVYYTAAFLVPLTRGAWADAGFWSHSIFVLLVPFVMVLLILLFGPRQRLRNRNLLSRGPG